MLPGHLCARTTVTSSNASSTDGGLSYAMMSSVTGTVVTSAQADPTFLTRTGPASLLKYKTPEGGISDSDMELECRENRRASGLGRCDCEERRKVAEEAVRTY
jgi:hypothetical protein